MTADGLKDQLVVLLTEKLEIQGEIAPETPFAELELDSLVMLEFSALLEQRYGVEIPEEDLLDAGDLAAVASLVLTRQGTATTRT